MPTTHDAVRDERRWMERAIFRALHAQLRSKEKRPVLRETEAAVWLTWHPRDQPPVEYRIEAERWWEPATDAHAEALAARLLAGLREALSARAPA